MEGSPPGVVPPVPPPIFTIGHSTRSLDELLALLRDHAIRTLADIRRYPGSRRLPHFSGESLSRALPEAGIAYVHLEELGGRRRPDPASRNGRWRNLQFRGYADHMATPAFHAAIDRMLALPAPVVLMCAEAVPWRCHRNLASDELVRRGRTVRHILGPGSMQEHALNPDATDAGGFLVYGHGAQRPLPLETGSED